MILAMDLDIAKELSRLQERRLALEATTDLSGRCDSLIELDRRVGRLSDQVRSLRVKVEGIETEDVCERLALPYRILNSTSQISSLIVGLKKLNRLCRLIDNDPYLFQPEGRKSVALIEYLQMASSEKAGGDGDSERPTEVVQALELLAEFESTYRQFEPILSARSDLPYKNYATRVRSLKAIIDELSKA